MLELLSRMCARLEDLRSTASESTHADWFVDHVKNPGCDCAVETLKGSPGTSLETYYIKVLYKAADVAKPKTKD